MTASPALDAVRGALVLGPSGPPVIGQWPVWVHNDPAAALECLVTREMLPSHWTDAARAPRWWCGECEGEGEGVVPPGRRLRCWRCVGGGHTARPTSLHDLVSVAALGVVALARAEAIVAETWPGRALVWRVMTAEKIREHHDEVHRNALPASLRGDRLITDAFVRAVTSESCFYDSPSVRRAWPALRALAAVGLHLVALDGDRVVLGVERVPVAS